MAWNRYTAPPSRPRAPSGGCKGYVSPDRVENLPNQSGGGPTIAINHTSYFDFTFAGLPAFEQGLGRKVRFMVSRRCSTTLLRIGRARRLMRGIRGTSRWTAATAPPAFEEACRLLKRGQRARRRLPRRHHQPKFRDQSSSSPARPGWRSPRAYRSCRTSCGAPSAFGPRAIPQAVAQGSDRIAVGEPIDRRCPRPS